MRSGGLPLLYQHLSQLLTLPLSADVAAQLLLEELECPLVARDPEQLHGALFVRREADHLAHQVTDELVVLGVHLGKDIQVVRRRNIRSAARTIRSAYQLPVVAATFTCLGSSILSIDV